MCGYGSWARTDLARRRRLPAHAASVAIDRRQYVDVCGGGAGIAIGAADTWLLLRRRGSRPALLEGTSPLIKDSERTC